MPTIPTTRSSTTRCSASFRNWVPHGCTVDAVSFRLYAHGSESDAAPQGSNTQRSELATRVLHIGANIVNMEAMRGTFAERSDPAYDAFVKVLSTDLRTEADNDEEDEEDEEDDGVESEEEEEEDDGDESEEDETRQYDRKRQKLKSIDRAETAQNVDLFHNKVSRPRGTKHCRQTKFKGDAPPHIAELFWGILACDQSAEYKNRIPTVGASTYNSGASLYWYPVGEGEGQRALHHREMCKLEEPSEDPDSSTVVTAKIRSLPPEERDHVEREYVELQTMAFKINWMMRDLFKQVADSFDIVAVLELEDCKRAKSKEYLDPGHMGLYAEARCSSTSTWTPSTSRLGTRRRRRRRRTAARRTSPSRTPRTKSTTSRR